MKSKIIKTLFIISCICLSFSCKNFLQGGDFLEELNNSIEYANSTSYSCSIICYPNGAGTTSPVDTISYKAGDSKKLEVRVNDGYEFLYWETVQASNNENKVTDYFTFDEPKATTTTISFNQGNSDILIRAVCAQKLGYKSVYPENKEGTVYPKDSSIIVEFNNNLSEDNTFDGLLISMDGNPVTGNYLAPVVTDNILTIAADSSNPIEISKNQTRTISVVIPSTVYYVSNGQKVALGSNLSWSFKINGYTNEKAVVTISCADDIGSVSPAGVNQINKGEKVDLKYTPKTGYRFDSWKVTVDGQTITAAENNSLTATNCSGEVCFEIDDVTSATAKLTGHGKTEDAQITPKVTELPYVVSSNPINGATGVLRNATVYITFNHKMNPDSFRYSAAELQALSYDELLKDGEGKAYGYKKDGVIVFKNVEIYNSVSGGSLLEHFYEPELIDENKLAIFGNTETPLENNAGVSIVLSKNITDADGIPLNVNTKLGYTTGKSVENNIPVLQRLVVKNNLYTFTENNNSLSFNPEYPNHTGNTFTCIVTGSDDSKKVYLVMEETNLKTKNDITITQPVTITKKHELPGLNNSEIQVSFQSEAGKDGLYKVCFYIEDEGGLKSTDKKTYLLVRDTVCEVEFYYQNGFGVDDYEEISEGNNFVTSGGTDKLIYSTKQIIDSNIRKFTISPCGTTYGYKDKWYDGKEDEIDKESVRISYGKNKDKLENSITENTDAGNGKFTFEIPQTVDLSTDTYLKISFSDKVGNVCSKDVIIPGVNSILYMTTTDSGFKTRIEPFVQLPSCEDLDQQYAVHCRLLFTGNKTEDSAEELPVHTGTTAANPTMYFIKGFDEENEPTELGLNLNEYNFLIYSQCYYVCDNMPYGKDIVFGAVSEGKQICNIENEELTYLKESYTLGETGSGLVTYNVEIPADFFEPDASVSIHWYSGSESIGVEKITGNKFSKTFDLSDGKLFPVLCGEIVKNTNNSSTMYDLFGLDLTFEDNTPPFVCSDEKGQFKDSETDDVDLEYIQIPALADVHENLFNKVPDQDINLNKRDITVYASTNPNLKKNEWSKLTPIQARMTEDYIYIPARAVAPDANYYFYADVSDYACLNMLYEIYLTYNFMDYFEPFAAECRNASLNVNTPEDILNYELDDFMNALGETYNDEEYPVDNFGYLLTSQYNLNKLCFAPNSDLSVKIKNKIPINSIYDLITIVTSSTYKKLLETCKKEQFDFDKSFTSFFEEELKDKKIDVLFNNVYSGIIGSSYVGGTVYNPYEENRTIWYKNYPDWRIENVTGYNNPQKIISSLKNDNSREWEKGAKNSHFIRLDYISYDGHRLQPLYFYYLENPTDSQKASVNEFSMDTENILSSKSAVTVMRDTDKTSIPTFVHIMYSTENYGDNVGEWELMGYEGAPQEIYTQKTIQFVEQDEGNAYRNIVPSGNYFVVIAHFADGLIVISDVYEQK